MFWCKLKHSCIIIKFNLKKCNVGLQSVLSLTTVVIRWTPGFKFPTLYQLYKVCDSENESRPPSFITLTSMWPKCRRVDWYRRSSWSRRGSTLWKLLNVHWYKLALAWRWCWDGLHTLRSTATSLHLLLVAANEVALVDLLINLATLFRVQSFWMMYRQRTMEIPLLFQGTWIGGDFSRIIDIFSIRHSTDPDDIHPSILLISRICLFNSFRGVSQSWIVAFRLWHFLLNLEFSFFGVSTEFWNDKFHH